MTCGRRTFLVLPLIVCFLPGQSTVPREIIQLARIKHEMSAVLSKLPDYTCMETVERSTRKRGADPFRRVDTIKLDVAFIGGKEVYAWHGARRIEEENLGRLNRTGVTSTGGFASHAMTVFVSETARVVYDGPEVSRGRAALRWDYKVPYLFSRWTLTYAGRSSQVAAHGSFWVDSASLELLRLDVFADEIPAGFPITAVHVGIDYEKVHLNANDVLIPQTTELLLSEEGGVQNRNLAKFSQCREYGAEAAISFGSENPDK
jgi:hypothetical protein